MKKKECNEKWKMQWVSSSEMLAASILSLVMQFEKWKGMEWKQDGREEEREGIVKWGNEVCSQHFNRNSLRHQCPLCWERLEEGKV